LAASMLRIYKDSVFRDVLVKRSLEQANKFSWKRCAQETFSAYKASLL
jgi:hypothetical protein